MEEIAEPKGQIFALLGKIMGELQAVGKNKLNPDQNFKYRGIDDLYNAAQPLMAKYGVFTVPRVLDEQNAERRTAGGKSMWWTRYRVEYRFYGPDGSFFTVVVMGEGQDLSDKAGNKALAGAHKYALLQVLMVPTQDLDDPDARSEPSTSSRPPAARSRPAAPQTKPSAPVQKQSAPRPKQEAVKEQTPLSDFVAAAKNSDWSRDDLKKFSEAHYKTADALQLSVDQLVEFTKTVKRPYAEIAAEMGL